MQCGKEFRITAHYTFSVHADDLSFRLHVRGAHCIEGSVIPEIKDIRDWSQFVSVPADYRRLSSDVINVEKPHFLDRFYLVRFAVLGKLAYIHSLDIEDRQIRGGSFCHITENVGDSIRNCLEHGSFTVPESFP